MSEDPKFSINDLRRIEASHADCGCGGDEDPCDVAQLIDGYKVIYRLARRLAQGLGVTHPRGLNEDEEALIANLRAAFVPS